MSLLAGEGADAVRTFHFDWLPLLSPLFFVLRLNAHCSHIRLTPTALDVQMGWAFSARIPLTALRSVAADEAFVGGIGVHGFGSRWLVNGSHRSICRLELDGAPARVLGVPLTLRTLRLGVAEREHFIAALREAAADDQ
jgi:hypothetical protein